MLEVEVGVEVEFAEESNGGTGGRGRGCGCCSRCRDCVFVVESGFLALSAEAGSSGGCPSRGRNQSGAGVMGMGNSLCTIFADQHVSLPSCIPHSLSLILHPPSLASAAEAPVPPAISHCVCVSASAFIHSFLPSFLLFCLHLARYRLDLSARTRAK